MRRGVLGIALVLLAIAPVIRAMASGDFAPGSAAALTAPTVFEAAGRFTPTRAVTILPRRTQAPWRHERIAPAESAVLSSIRPVRVEDIRAGSVAAPASERVATVAFARPLPDFNRAGAVEVRAITRIGRPHPAIVVAQTNADAAPSAEQLREHIQHRAATIAVDVSKPATVQSTASSAPHAEAAVTIVGRPGQKVRELAGAESHELEDAAPVLNQMSPTALAREEAARQAIADRNQELKELRHQEAEGLSDVDIAEPPHPLPVVEVEMVRRYDWRKGIYVREAKDAPPIPAPSVAVGPAGLAGDSDAGDGTVLRGRVPKVPNASDEESPPRARRSR